MLESNLERRIKTKPRREFACPTAGFDICGRLIMERERYANLEVELERARRDVKKYREYFSILLKRVESSLMFHIIPEIFRHNISQISEVKEIHYFKRRNIASFWVFLDKENWEAEDQIYEIYGELLSMFQEADIRVRLLRLWGRNAEDLLPAGGIKILG